MANLNDFIERGMAFFNGQTVSAAELTAANEKLTLSAGRVAELEIDLGLAKDALTEESKILAIANQNLSTITAERDSLKAEVEKLKADAKTIDEAAAIKAQQIAASQGIPVGKLPENDPDVQSKEAEIASIRSKIGEEKDPIKRSQMAIKLRELRGHGDLFKSQ
jgi:chromosome segregation ATPase